MLRVRGVRDISASSKGIAIAAEKAMVLGREVWEGEGSFDRVEMKKWAVFGSIDGSLLAYDGEVKSERVKDGVIDLATNEDYATIIPMAPAFYLWKIDENKLISFKKGPWDMVKMEDLIYLVKANVLCAYNEKGKKQWCKEFAKPIVSMDVVEGDIYISFTDEMILFKGGEVRRAEGNGGEVRAGKWVCLRKGNVLRCYDRELKESAIYHFRSPIKAFDVFDKIYVAIDDAIISFTFKGGEHGEEYLSCLEEGGEEICDVIDKLGLFKLKLVNIEVPGRGLIRERIEEVLSSKMKIMESISRIISALMELVRLDNELERYVEAGSREGVKSLLSEYERLKEVISKELNALRIEGVNVDEIVEELKERPLKAALKIERIGGFEKFVDSLIFKVAREVGIGPEIGETLVEEVESRLRLCRELGYT